MKNYHYYTHDQSDLESNEQTFDYHFNDLVFRFTTDNGVFSKSTVDFGSMSLLKHFQPNDIPLDILDVGCGYGPIGIIVSKLYNKRVEMIDVNERAIGLANKNIEKNHVNAIAYFSDVFENVGPKKFSSILTNPPIRAGKDVVFKIYEGAYEHLEKDGELWVVIQKKQGAPSSKDHLTEIFGNCEIVKREKGYFILKCKKMC